MDEEYLDFFLGGDFGNNPVALEIPIKSSKTSLENLDDNKRAEILTMLREHGLDAGDEPGQIMVSNDSIITPIIAPENIKPLYKTIEFLLQHYHVGSLDVLPPHVIDVKYIVPSHLSGLSDTDWAERINYVDNMLRNISDQKSYTLDSDIYYIKRRFEKEVTDFIEKSGYRPINVLFAGGSISDPYSVATGQSNRYLRYATTDPFYATRYVFADGKPNNFDLMSKSGIKYGFLFLYKKREDFRQYLFYNGGIEFGEKGHLGALPDPSAVDETMVNRFNNECIGEYLFIGVPVIHEKGHTYYKYGYVKMDSNDEAWKRFKEYAKTENARLLPGKDDRFDAWAAGQNLEPVLPLLDKEKSISEFYESVLDIRHNEDLAEQNAVDKINQQIEQLSESFKKSFAELDETMNSFKEQEDNPDYNAQITYYDNALNTLKNIESIKNDLYQSLSEKISSLKSDIEKSIRWSYNRQQLLDAMYEKVRDLGTKKTNLDEKLKQQRENLGEWRNHTEHDKYIYITKFFNKTYTSFTDFDKQVMQYLDLESKKEILLYLIADFNNEHTRGEKKFLAEWVLFVYYCSTPQQRVELFDVLYKLRKTKKSADIRKILKESNAKLVSDGFKLCSEIEELVKNDNIFVKHTKKAKEMVMKFKKATQKLQDDMFQKQNVVRQVVSDERH